MISKAASNTIFLIFGITQPGIEPWSPGALENTLVIRPMAQQSYQSSKIIIIRLDMHSDLKATQVNMQGSLIWELMLL